MQVDERLSALQEHQVDVLCGAMSITLDRRKQVDFSVPMFPGGVGVVVRKDAPRQPPEHPGGPGEGVHADLAGGGAQHRSRAGLRDPPWHHRRSSGSRRGERSSTFRSPWTPVANYDEGIKAVLDRKVNGFFGERAILLDAVRSNPSGSDLTVIDRQFTYEPLALPMASHGLWQRRFGSDAKLLGKTIDVNIINLSRIGPTPAFVVGIALAEVHFPPLSAMKA